MSEQGAVGDPHRSLIRQRMEIERGSTLNIWILVIAAVSVLLWMYFAVTDDGESMWNWLVPLALVALWVVTGAAAGTRLFRARARLRAFEQEHGSDAGRQEPVR